MTGPDEHAAPIFWTDSLAVRTNPMARAANVQTPPYARDWMARRVDLMAITSKGAGPPSSLQEVSTTTLVGA